MSKSINVIACALLSIAGAGMVIASQIGFVASALDRNKDDRQFLADSGGIVFGVGSTAFLMGAGLTIILVAQNDK